MRRNKIPLSAFLGINILTIGILFIVVSGFILSDMNLDIERLRFERLMELAIPSLLGGSLFLSGIGLLLKKHWARIVLNILLILCLAGLSLAIYFLIANALSYSRHWRVVFAQAGATIFMLSMLVGIFLFLNNTRVIDELKQKPPSA